MRYSIPTLICNFQTNLLLQIQARFKVSLNIWMHIWENLICNRRNTGFNGLWPDKYPLNRAFHEIKTFCYSVSWDNLFKYSKQELALLVHLDSIFWGPTNACKNGESMWKYIFFFFFIPEDSSWGGVGLTWVFRLASQSINITKKKFSPKLVTLFKQTPSENSVIPSKN